MAGVFKGSLNLDKIVGLRVDKNQKMHMLKVKEDKTAKPAVKKSMKNTANTLRGKKYT